MARDEAYAKPADGDAPGALAFVHDHQALARRFILAELMAKPLALRGRRARTEDDARSRPRNPSHDGAASGPKPRAPAEPSGEGGR